MTSVADALQVVLSRASQLPAESVPLAAALDRVLREPACADLDSPPFDASAMDGYALRLADAGRPLRVVGTSQAGAAFAGRLGPGECVRIFTGAPVPADAEAIAKQEDAARDGDSVRLAAGAASAAFIRRRGENRRAGDVVVPAGARLAAPELAALAANGVTRPSVTRRPRVGHVVTGDELVAPDRTPAGAQIRDSNSSLVAALVARHGGELTAHRHLRDDPSAATTELAALPDHDVLLISGGAGAGDRDFARPVLTALGYTLHFEQVNLRPGKPLVFASRGPRLAFVLPGNPVSHWVTFNLFVGPLLRKLLTGADAAPPRLPGRLAAGGTLPPPESRQTVWPARVDLADNGHQVTLLTLASSGDSSGLVGANALVPLPANGLDPARPVEFIPCP